MSAAKKWTGIGLAAITFILAFKFVAKKSGNTALTQVAGQI